MTDVGRDAPSILCVEAAACPDALEFHTQEWRGGRLLLEGKLAQLSLRLMRSKRSILTIGRYGAVTFDLIRSGLSRTTVVEV